VYNSREVVVLATAAAIAVSPFQIS
jgi:hypothetical protein